MNNKEYTYPEKKYNENEIFYKKNDNKCSTVSSQYVKKITKFYEKIRNKIKENQLYKKYSYNQNIGYELHICDINFLKKKI